MTPILAQIGRFGVVGVAATLIHLALAWIAARGFDAAPLTANSLGFVAAFACSYFGHLYWTFGQRTGHPVTLPRFVVVSGVSLLLTSVITWAVDHAGLPFEVTLAAILLTVPLVTWLLSKYWAFRF